MNNNASIKKNNELKVLIFITLIIILGVVLGSTYAFFNYTRIGNPDVLNTGYIDFDFNGGSEIEKGNAFPIEEADVDNTIVKTFSLTSHTTFTDGIVYRIYAVYGDNVSGKTRLRDDVVSFEFIPPEDANGFITEINNYSSPKSLSFTNGKALISTGIIKNTSNLTTKNYTLKLWIDSSKINISSTTKRATNAEGNPSLADATTGTTTAIRYMRNDTTELTTVTLYPAITSQQGKIIYTTNEFSNSYYSFKILVEAEDYDGETVYLDANGGNVSTTMLKVTPGETYPVLPTPTRAGYTFLGWNGKNNTHEVNSNNYSCYNFNKKTTSQFMVNDSKKYVRFNGNNSDTNIDTSWFIYSNDFLSLKENTNYILSFDVRSQYSLSTQSIIKRTGNTNGKTGIYVNSSATNENLITSIDKSYEFSNDGNWYRIEAKIVTSTGYNSGILVIGNDSPNLYGPNSYIDIANIQFEEGSVATAYEPYYVDNTVTVTQEKDHVLKAIWQKNS